MLRLPKHRGLGQLRSLDLSGNQLEELPLALWSHPRLVELDLRGNPLSELPPITVLAPALRKISLVDTMLTKTPVAFIELLHTECLADWLKTVSGVQ